MPSQFSQTLSAYRPFKSKSLLIVWSVLYIFLSLFLVLNIESSYISHILLISVFINLFTHSQTIKTKTTILSTMGAVSPSSPIISLLILFYLIWPIIHCNQSFKKVHNIKMFLCHRSRSMTAIEAPSSKSLVWEKLQASIVYI